MFKKFFATLFSFFIFVCATYSQVDSLSQNNVADSSLHAQAPLLDSNAVQQISAFANFKSFITETKGATQNDIQQFHSAKHNGFIFLLLLLLLAALTYVKTGFSKQLEEMLQSVINQNISQQIFRTQSGEISFADILLHANFIVTISLYARFFLVNYFHVSSLESFTAILFLIFLFTFFYLAKIITVVFIANIFEQQATGDEYVFNFTTLCKTLGLTLLPALFIFYTAPVKIFNFIFIITILFFVAFAFIFVWRALSTAYKLLYRGVYHFFIYVCVVEISMMFLFFKLLTKTIT